MPGAMSSDQKPYIAFQPLTTESFHFPDTPHCFQQSRPASTRPEYLKELLLFSFSHNKFAYDHEPRRTRFSLALYLGYDFFCHRARSFIVMRKVHGERCPALCARTHVGRVAEHLSQRNQRLDHLRTSAVLHA